MEGKLNDPRYLEPEWKKMQHVHESLLGKKPLFIIGKILFPSNDMVINLKTKKKRKFMLVKCIDKSGENLPADCLTEELRFKNGGKDNAFDLVIGKFYVVYAMALFGKYMWYAICEANNKFPIFSPSPFFSIENNLLSKYWVFSFQKQSYSFLANSILTFSEWSNDDYFYSNLLEGYEKEIKIFSEYKIKMDLEFPSPNITATVEKIDDSWVLCPFCIDAWEPNSKAGMIICPSCNRTFLNPFYRA